MLGARQVSHDRRGRRVFVLDPSPALEFGSGRLSGACGHRDAPDRAVPFTWLVHMFSGPVQYLFRPSTVYRFRDPRKAAGERAVPRGWEPIER